MNKSIYCTRCKSTKMHIEDPQTKQVTCTGCGAVKQPAQQSPGNAAGGMQRKMEPRWESVDEAAGEPVSIVKRTKFHEIS